MRQSFENRFYRLILIGVLLFLPAFVLSVEVRSEQRQKAQRPFDLSKHSIPLNEIQEGGPPRDGIPAILDPKFVSTSEADRFLRKNDRIIGVIYQGEARAYPIKILNWHEAVNDKIGSVPFLVSW